MSIEKYLGQVSMFKSLAGGNLEALASSVSCQSLKKGEVLFRKGSEGNALYVIKSGSIRISLTSRDGDEITLAVFSEGDFLGEMALLDGMPRSADAVALEPTEVLVLSRTAFIGFLKKNEEAIDAILCALSMRLRKTDDLLEDTCFLNISKRFAKKLVELAGSFGTPEGPGVIIDLSLTQRDLASMVGATRESINKELRRLREKGVLCTEGNRIRIFNMDLLERRAR